MDKRRLGYDKKERGELCEKSTDGLKWLGAERKSLR